MTLAQLEQANKIKAELERMKHRLGTLNGLVRVDFSGINETTIRREGDGDEQLFLELAELLKNDTVERIAKLEAEFQKL